ncbi:hypothetical protein M2133_000164 [Parabacteroides sp. PF5-6]|nr:hypothetical protein [Parabacteroides sp. PF5-6]
MQAMLTEARVIAHNLNMDEYTKKEGSANRHK